MQITWRIVYYQLGWVVEGDIKNRFGCRSATPQNEIERIATVHLPIVRARENHSIVPSDDL